MNERIKLLALQARAEVRADWDKGNKIPYPEAHDAFQRDNDQKFAELIIREMCQVINDDCELQMRQRIITNLGGLNQARELIKQHFGVEE